MVLVLAAACGASGGGGGGGGGGPVIGSLCDPATQKQMCSGSARVQCTAAASGGGTWTLIEVCTATSFCSVVQSGQAGMYDSLCSGGGGGGGQGDTTTSTGDGTTTSGPDTKGKDTTTSTGCVPVDCDDGVACTEDFCIAGNCQNTPDDAQCEDGNPCTKDQCQGSGCKYASLANQPCNDGDTCTSGDTCTAAKTCVGKAKNCDDGDPCTADSCASGQCQHEKTTGCADGSSMDAALPLAMAKQQQGDLANGPLWYTFDGDAGDVIGVVLATAQQSSPYDPQIIDTVVEVWYGGKPIAANDDNPEGADNDSFLITMLPQSGTYYVKVSECWDWLAANPNPNLSCAAPQTKSQSDFMVVVLNNAQLSPPFALEESEPNDSKTAAKTVTYETNSEGKYLIRSLVGQLASTDKGDWFSMQPPTDTPVNEGRSTAYFTAWTPGMPLGTGSS
ncbi:MAG: PPC domain-containing protein, partial [Deltaproteobacteria bacterium]|nr:PPC domain-containing protein [Deltaproteobacteria bacterium]